VVMGSFGNLGCRGPPFASALAPPACIRSAPVREANPVIFAYDGAHHGPARPRGGGRIASRGLPGTHRGPRGGFRPQKREMIASAASTTIARAGDPPRGCTRAYQPPRCANPYLTCPRTEKINTRLSLIFFAPFFFQGLHNKGNEMYTFHVCIMPIKQLKVCGK